MKSNIRDFLDHCETIDFGGIMLSKMEKKFYGRFNKEIISFCRSLPESTQTESLLFVMQYAGITIGEELDFFARYYPPTWSILYWLNHDRRLSTKRLKKGDVAKAVTAQSLAMFLHSLDDHLADKQLSVSPLTLLLRSQTWTIMNQAFYHLTDGLSGGRKTVRDFIDGYYSSMHDSSRQESLDNYCHFFRRQMALGMVAPVLLSRKITGKSAFARDIEIAFGSFGIAWRLLDDIKDIRQDIEKGAHSAIYLCLSKKGKAHWNKPKMNSCAVAKDSLQAILNYVFEDRIIDNLKERICAELDKATSIVEAYGLNGLAREFECLAYPLRKSRS